MGNVFSRGARAAHASARPGELELAADKLDQTLLDSKHIPAPHSRASSIHGNDGPFMTYDWHMPLPEEAASCARCFEVSKTTKGSSHLDTLSTALKLARGLMWQNELQDAKRVVKKVVSLAVAAEGYQTSITLNAMSLLGDIYVRQGKLPKAVEKYQRAVAGFKKVFEESESGKDEAMQVVGSSLAHIHRDTSIEEASPVPRSISTMGDDSMTFNRDIKLLDATGRWVGATALLDTQCHIGNWISKRLVQRLGMSPLISTSFEPPEIFEASGRPVRACGLVDLSWRWHPRGTRNHECQFYILPESEHLDVLFGVDYILSEGILHVNESALLPLVEHKKSKKDDKAAIAAAEERQRQEKAALEERRRQKEEEERKKRQAEQDRSQKGNSA